MIKIVKGDIFKNLKDDVILLHACNAQGVWGSGVAVEFKNRFPQSYTEYKNFCEEQAQEYHWGARGMCLITSENIACLVTSFKYGKEKDDPATILKSTSMALEDMFNQLVQKQLVKVYSPKINSGLFQVPWRSTEEVIQKCIYQSSLNVEWTVFEL